MEDNGTQAMADAAQADLIAQKQVEAEVIEESPEQAQKDDHVDPAPATPPAAEPEQEPATIDNIAKRVFLQNDGQGHIIVPRNFFFDSAIVKNWINNLTDNGRRVVENSNGDFVVDATAEVLALRDADGYFPLENLK
jgi:hypothetical protein